MVALIEIKARYNRSYESFDTIILNLDKFFTLLLSEIYLSLPAFYVIGFSDGIFYIKVTNIPNEQIVIKGRTDRPGIANDIRPAIMIPRNLFKNIANK